MFSSVIILNSILNLIIFLFVLSILILVHEFGHFIIAKKIGIRIEEFFLGLGGKKLFSKRINGTEYGIRVLLIGGYVKPAGDNLEEYKGKPDEYLSKPPGKRFWVIFCGPLCNYILGFLCFWLIFFVGFPTFTTKVGGLIDGWGAKDAGVRIGDKILAVDGKKVRFFEELQLIIQEKKNATKVQLLVSRDNTELSVDVIIKEKQLEDIFGKKHSTGLLGITPADEFVKIRHGFFESFYLGIKRTWGLTNLTYKGLWLMVTGKLALRESAAGPLGIYFITSKVARQGIIPLLNLIGLISVSLAIFNCLPLPLLDGGHILLLGLEKTRGKFLSKKSERIITQIGWTAIISLILFITYNDISRIFGDRLSGLFK
jgi:regulator of sigma E protease